MKNVRKVSQEMLRDLAQSPIKMEQRYMYNPVKLQNPQLSDWKAKEFKVQRIRRCLSNSCQERQQENLTVVIESDRHK